MIMTAIGIFLIIQGASIVITRPFPSQKITLFSVDMYLSKLKPFDVKRNWTELYFKLHFEEEMAYPYDLDDVQ